VRPEHLREDPAGSLAVVVQLFEQLGANTLLHGHLDGTETEIVVSLPGHVTVEAGTVMRFAVPAEALHVFDAESGKRVEI
jgi:sn-glycerol 3-phosphate transport system ATP-binding protein